MKKAIVWITIFKPMRTKNIQYEYTYSWRSNHLETVVCHFPITYKSTQLWCKVVCNWICELPASWRPKRFTIEHLCAPIYMHGEDWTIRRLRSHCLREQVGALHIGHSKKCKNRKSLTMQGVLKLYTFFLAGDHVDFLLVLPLPPCPNLFKHFPRGCSRNWDQWIILKYSLFDGVLHESNQWPKVGISPNITDRLLGVAVRNNISAYIMI